MSGVLWKSTFDFTHVVKWSLITIDIDHHFFIVWFSIMQQCTLISAYPKSFLMSRPFPSNLDQCPLVFLFAFPLSLCITWQAFLYSPMHTSWVYIYCFCACI
ncbi:hypothetical protein BC943DRAFT_56959 [Umbelopsis sp. AD052]|nr:hypothetical protein BC943DRAFT_56959 [Umbelopsis sp. AD052]